MVIKTLDEIEKILEDKNIELLEEYKGKVAYKHKVKCKVCGNIENKQLNYIFRNETACNKCAQEKRQNSRRGKNYLQNMIKENENYEWLEDLPKYIKDIKKVKLDIKHLDCGHVYKTSVTQFQKGKGRCPLCRKLNKSVVKVPDNKEKLKLIKERKPLIKKKRKEVEKDNRRISKVNKTLLEDSINKRSDGNEYEWLEEYSYSNKDKHFIRHKVCNYIYQVRPNDFNQGYSCPNCSRKSSKIERELVKYLSKNNIEFELEKSINKYKFDIYLNKEKLLIEIDGEQHFDLDSTWNKKSKVKENDINKNNIIIDENLKLLRISFHSKKDKIEEHLKKFDDFIKSGNTDKVYFALLENNLEDLDNYYEFNNKRSKRDKYCRH